MRCVKNDVEVVFNINTIPTYYCGDKYGCVGCDNEIITGFGESHAHPYNLERFTVTHE